MYSRQDGDNKNDGKNERRTCWGSRVFSDRVGRLHGGEKQLSKGLRRRGRGWVRLPQQALWAIERTLASAVGLRHEQRVAVEQGSDMLRFSFNTPRLATI